MAKSYEEKLCGLMQGDFQDTFFFFKCKRVSKSIQRFLEERREIIEYTHVSGHLTIKKQREDKTQNNDCLPVGYIVKVKSLSCVQLVVTPWTVAYQAPPSVGFSRQEYWSGLPFPFPGDLPYPGIEPGSPAL